MKFPKYKPKLWHFVLLVVVAALAYFWGPLTQALGLIGTWLNGIINGAKKVTDSLTNMLGLNQQANQTAQDATTPTVDNCWSADYYKQATIPDNCNFLGNSEEVALIQAFKDARSFWSGTNMTQIEALFGKFESKAMFSHFCETFNQTQMDSFAGWLQSTSYGALFGLIKNSDFLILDGIVQKLPPYTIDLGTVPTI